MFYRRAGREIFLQKHLFSLQGARCWTSAAEAPVGMCSKSYVLVPRAIFQASPL